MLLVQSTAAHIHLKAIFSFYFCFNLQLRNKNRKGMGGSLMHLKLIPGSSIPLASTEYVFFLECLQEVLCYCISFLLVILTTKFTLKQLL